MVFELIEPSEDIDLDTIDIKSDLEIKKEPSEIEGNLEENPKSNFYVKKTNIGILSIETTRVRYH